MTDESSAGTDRTTFELAGVALLVLSIGAWFLHSMVMAL